MTTTARPLEPTALSAGERAEIRRRLLRDLVGGALLGVSALHRVVRPGEEALSSAIAAAAALLVGLPVMVRGGLGLLRPGGVRFTDQLVALATFAAFTDGQLATSTLVPLVFDLGRLFEERSALGLRAAITGLQRLSARSAAQIEALGHADERRVDPATLGPGALLRVRPGELVPADGWVRAGASTVDQSALTGESTPEDVHIGDRVFSGSLNVSGLIEIEVSAAAADSALGRVAQLLVAVDAARPAALRQLDRYARGLLPLVLVAAAAVLAFTEDMGRAIAVLVAAAPTGLVVAGPVSFIAALTAAARRDLLIKGAGFLEALPQIDTVVFDKTGTLTTGQIDAIAVEPVAGVSVADVLGAGAAAAFGSLHPASRAVRTAAAAAQVDPWPAHQWREVPGRGVEAASAAGTLRLGRAAWVGAPVGTAAEVWVSVDGRPLGRVLLGDRLRVDAADTLRALRSEGVDRVLVLTGDGPAEARRITQALADAGAEIDGCEFSMLPEGKLSAVQRLTGGGARVMMVGDGVNDALALAAADVGVAFGLRRSEVVLGGADVALHSERLSDLVALLQLGRAVRSVLHQNIALALGWNAALMAAAAGGALPPLVAAAAQHLGAVWVLANAARLLRVHGAVTSGPPLGDPWAIDGGPAIPSAAPPGDLAPTALSVGLRAGAEGAAVGAEDAGAAGPAAPGAGEGAEPVPNDAQPADVHLGADVGAIAGAPEPAAPRVLDPPDPPVRGGARSAPDAVAEVSDAVAVSDPEGPR